MMIQTGKMFSWVNPKQKINILTLYKLTIKKCIQKLFGDNNSGKLSTGMLKDIWNISILDSRSGVSN